MPSTAAPSGLPGPLYFKISSMWSCTGNPCSVLSMGTVLQKTKIMEGPSIVCATIVRHEKRKQSRSASRNNSPHLPSQMLEGPCPGPSGRAYCKFFGTVPLICGRWMWSWVWKHTPLNRRDSAVCLQGADDHRMRITSSDHLHDQISACWLTGKAVTCYPIKPCGFVNFPHCFSLTSLCFLVVSGLLPRMQRHSGGFALAWLPGPWAM